MNLQAWLNIMGLGTKDVSSARRKSGYCCLKRCKGPRHSPVHAFTLILAFDATHSRVSSGMLKSAQRNILFQLQQFRLFL